MAIYMGDILIKGSFSPQVHCYAHGATLLFLVLGWCLIWKKVVSSQIYRLPIFDFYPSWLCSRWPLLGLSLGVPDCCLCAGVWRTLSLCMVLRVFMAHRSLWVQCHFLDAALQCLSEVAPRSISFCLLPKATIIFAFKGHCISCLVEFSFADLLPRLLFQLRIWTLPLWSGQILAWAGVFLETRAAPGSMGLFLGLVTLPGCTLFIKEFFLLWEQAVSYFPSSSVGLLQEGTQQWTSF